MPNKNESSRNAKMVTTGLVWSGLVTWSGLVCSEFWRGTEIEGILRSPCELKSKMQNI